MIVSAVRTVELGDALGLLYGPDAGDLSGLVAHGFRLVARGDLNPDDLLVARSGDSVVGAVFAQRLPGATGVLWPPRAVPEDPAVEDALTTAALRHVAGVKVVQAFLSPEEAGRAAPLLRGGFRRVTTVWEMRRALNPSPGPSPKAGGEKGETLRVSGSVPPLALGEGVRGRGLRLTPYPETDPDLFHRTLLAAHDDSRDCPELHGVRTPDEVLAGYRDCAPDPARWWLAHADGDPAGVLLLSDADLTFVGVVPERRGRGIGRALVTAAGGFAPDLSLIVDERNTPAVQLYESAGFRVVGTREVFLHLPASPAVAIDPKVFRS